MIDDESLVKTRTNTCLSYTSAVPSYSVIPDSFPLRREKAPIRYGMYNFQKLSETTFLRCNNPFFHATESYPIQYSPECVH